MRYIVLLRVRQDQAADRLRIDYPAFDSLLRREVPEIDTLFDDMEVSQGPAYLPDGQRLARLRARFGAVYGQENLITAP